MSAEATGWVWRFSPYRGAELLVHLAIADVVNDARENEFWMSTSKLAEKAKVARSSVTATLSDMVARGLLRVLEAGGDSRRPTRYQFMTSAVVGLVGGESLARNPGLTRPVTGHEPNRTQDTKRASALIGLAECPRCQGRGHYFHAGSGQDVKCQCSREATA